MFSSVCVSVRGWKSYDMWQLVGRCQRGRMEQRRKRLLPRQRGAGVADGRVAWSSCQLRQRELRRNNANDSLLLLWLWTTGLRNIVYASETHVPSLMTTADHYTAVAPLNPVSLHPLLHPRPLSAVIPQQVKFKTVCLLPSASEVFWLETKESVGVIWELLRLVNRSINQSR